MTIQNEERIEGGSQAVDLLKRLVQTQSFSGEEDQSAQILADFLTSSGVEPKRLLNNIWVRNRAFDPAKPTLLLNSHHDTVRPASNWSFDPFGAVIRDGRLIGLGSNDAGASLVCLLQAFLHYYSMKDLRYNLIFAATAEEETSGKNGIQSVLPELGRLDLAIVGEPTGMEMAVAEKGLIVLRCQAHGVSGHAARDVGENAILQAMRDIEWFSTYAFPKISPWLGPVKMTVTMIEAGSQHNVIPDRCQFTVDVRTTDVYRREEVMDTIRRHIGSEIVRCSLRLKPSSIDSGHELVRIAERLGIPRFGSPTMSDQTHIDAPSIKMGPGRSQRSHTADEFIYLDEISDGIERYITLLDELLLTKDQSS